MFFQLIKGYLLPMIPLHCQTFTVDIYNLMKTSKMLKIHLKLMFLINLFYMHTHYIPILVLSTYIYTVLCCRKYVYIPIKG